MTSLPDHVVLETSHRIAAARRLLLELQDVLRGIDPGSLPEGGLSGLLESLAGLVAAVDDLDVEEPNVVQSRMRML